MARFRCGLIFPGYRVERWYWEGGVAMRKSAVAAFGIFGNGLESAVLALWCTAFLALAPTIQTVEDSFAADDRLQRLELGTRSVLGHHMVDTVFIGRSRDVLPMAIVALHAVKSAVATFGIFGNGRESEVLAHWRTAVLPRGRVLRGR